MSNAIKCDRCGACYEYGGMTVGEEYDLCDGCIADFEAWMECQPVTGAPERVTESGEMPHDTREKLEADVCNYLDYPNNCRAVYDVEAVKGWLDRQAAITEREVKLRELHKFEENHRWHVRSIEEVNQQLNERIAELQREIATLKEHRAGNMERLHELTDECAELRKYRDEWKGLAEKYRADSIAAQEETERYRAKLGDVLDALHEAEMAAR